MAGGTSLALQYQHRVSIDIDLMTNEIIGQDGFRAIREEVIAFYGKDRVKALMLNEEKEEQYVFLRCFITKIGGTIKVEILQNMQYIEEPTRFDGYRLLSKLDVGLLKLMSASNRFMKKDIYDLDYITDHIDIIELFTRLKEKQKTFEDDQYKCLFDLDDEKSPVGDLNLLLAFDRQRPHAPFHTHDRIDITDNGKPWAEAKRSWRSKMRKLYEHEGKDSPSPKGWDIS